MNGETSMGMRQAISEKPQIGYGIAGGLLLIGLVIIFVELHGRSVAAGETQHFYTIDDGKTWFADDATKTPPFDKDGKQAVRAYVFRAQDGTKFVGYLERFKPDAQRLIDSPAKLNSNGVPMGQDGARDAYTAGREVKRPGDKQWIPANRVEAAIQVMMVKSPNGGTDPESVEP